MEMCGSVINYLMLKRHTHIGVISIQVKQENISFPITQYSLTAVKHKPQARKKFSIGKFAKYFKRTKIQHLKGIYLFTPDVTHEMQPCKRRWMLSNCSNVNAF